MSERPESAIQPEVALPPELAALLISAPLGDDTLLTLGETARVLRRRSTQSIYRLHWAGRMPFFKLGASTMCKLGDIRKIVAEMPRVVRPPRKTA